MITLSQTLINIKLLAKHKVYAFVILLVLLVADLYTKYLAFTILPNGSISIIDNYFSLSLAFNTGVSFSMFNDLANGALILSSFAIIAGFVISFISLTSKTKVDCYGFALIASGAFANGIDRAYNGFVIDMLDVYYKNSHYPTFNLADCFIFIGVAIILLEPLYKKKSSK